MSGGGGRRLAVRTPEHEGWLRRWAAGRRPQFEADAGLQARAAREPIGELEGGLGPDARALAALDPTVRTSCPPLAAEGGDLNDDDNDDDKR